MVDKLDYKILGLCTIDNLCFKNNYTVASKTKGQNFKT